MERLESTVSGCVTAGSPGNCAISQRENVHPVVDVALLVSVARSVSYVHCQCTRADRPVASVRLQGEFI